MNAALIRRNRFDTGEEDKALARVTVRYLRRRPTSRMAPFTFQWFYRLHGEIFGQVWRGGAGKRRTTEANIGARPSQIDRLVWGLALDAACWQGDPVDDAAELHRRAVQIHPFIDGNGRWARLLASIWIRQRTGQLLKWPLGLRHARSPLRDEYIDAIVRAVRGDTAALKALHRRLVEPWPDARNPK